jgi:hypothetical protein
MISTHESGAQEDQFDGKKEGQKSRGTIPLTSYWKDSCYRICRLAFLLNSLQENSKTYRRKNRQKVLSIVANISKND